MADNPAENQILGVTASLGQLNRQVESLAKNTASTATMQRNWPMFFMQMGYAAEDANYGVHALANNLGMMAMAIAPGSPWTVGIQIGAAAVTTLALHWEQLNQLVKTKNPIPKLGDDFEELNKEISKTVAQMGQLEAKGTLSGAELAVYNQLAIQRDNMRERAREVQIERENAEAVVAVKGDEITAAGSEVAAAIREAGGGAAVQMNMLKAGVDFDQANEMILQAMRGGAITPQLDAAIPGLKARVDEAINQREKQHQADLVEQAGRAAPGPRAAGHEQRAEIEPRDLAELNRGMRADQLRREDEFNERQRQMAIDRNVARQERAAMMGQGMGLGDVAAANMMALVDDPRFRRFAGAGTREEAITAAEEQTRMEMERRLRFQGFNAETAARMASEATSGAVPQVMEATKELAKVFPTSSKEMAIALKEHNKTMRESMRRGIPVVWSD